MGIENTMKSVNDFVKSWGKKLSPNDTQDDLKSSVDTVVEDVLKCVGVYNYNLTWDQISILEKALGDLVTNRYHRRDTNVELLSVISFITSCGAANTEKETEVKKMKEYGLDELKNEIMEGVPLDEISKKDIRWCAAKWYLIMGHTYAGTLADEVFRDPEYNYARLLVKLEERIKALGGKVVSMQSVEIPK